MLTAELGSECKLVPIFEPLKLAETSVGKIKNPLVSVLASVINDGNIVLLTVSEAPNVPDSGLPTIGTVVPAD